MVKYTIFAAFLVGLFSIKAWAGDLLLSPDSPSLATKSHPVSHAVDFRVVVTPPHKCKVLKVWLPLPMTSGNQQIEERELSTFPQQVKAQISQEPKFGNTFAYFEFTNPKGAQIIRHKFAAKTWELTWNLDFQKVSEVEKWPTAFDPYFEKAALQESEEYQKTFANILQNDSRASGFQRALAWVDSNMTYSHTNASLQADEEHAFTQQQGHCSDYHGLCATFGRSLGVPTRVVYGLAMMEKDSPSHCKLEAYLPPYGWVTFDLSETQKMVNAIQAADNITASEKKSLIAAARSRFNKGFRDNTWLKVTQGVNYELAPKASKPVRIVRTIYAEADGEALPEPDPSNVNNREYAWMTAHSIQSKPNVSYPYKDFESLK